MGAAAALIQGHYQLPVFSHRAHPSSLQLTRYEDSPGRKEAPAFGVKKMPEARPRAAILYGAAVSCAAQYCTRERTAEKAGERRVRTQLRDERGSTRRNLPDSR